MAAAPRHDTVLRATLAGLRDRLRPKQRLRLRDDERLDGETALVTGANRGLGFAIADQLARRGARLVLACRSGGPEAAAGLRAMTGNPAIEAVAVDLAEPDSIAALLEQLARTHDRLGRVVLNAALVPKASRRATSGLDLMFQVNYLGAVQLCEGLIDAGLVGADEGGRPARIVVISSEAHRSAEPADLAKFADIAPYSTAGVMTQYGRNKLYLTAYAWELGRVLDPRAVGLFVLGPGAVATDIAREAPPWLKPILGPTMRLLFQSPALAAEPATWLCCARELDGQGPLYLHMHARKQPAAWVLDPAAGAALRRASRELIVAGAPDPL